MGYKKLLQQYLSAEIDVYQFSRRYFDKFKKETRDMDEAMFLILDQLFGEIDGFTENETLLAEEPDFYLTESQLKERVKAVLEQLTD